MKYSPVILIAPQFVALGTCARSKFGGCMHKLKLLWRRMLGRDKPKHVTLGEFLGHDARLQYMHNVLGYQSTGQGQQRFLAALDQCDDWSLVAAFVWRDTPEGWDYWAALHDAWEALCESSD